jgi:hypothetical protein
MGFYRGPNIVRNGLIAYYDAANTKSYPGTGTDWYDISGNGQTASISSGEFVSGTNGGYLRNTGNVSNFFIVSVGGSVIDAALSVTTGGWTIEEIIWTNSCDYPECDAGSVASNPAYGVGATGFDWNHGTNYQQFKFGQSSNSASGYEDDITFNLPSPYNVSNYWRLRTMTWDRTNNSDSLYINGNYINSVSTPNTAGGAIYDGGGISFGSLYGWKFYGRRISIKMYDRVLTSSEILQNYNGVKNRLI